MKILFLDIDGVVNCVSTKQRHRGAIGIDPHMAFMVGKIVLDTGCSVVLSSSWRHWEEGMKEIRRQVVDFIDTTGRDLYGRGKEIQNWLDQHPEVTKYAILDDDSDMLESQLPNFFKTTWAYGLTPEIAESVTAHLNA